MHPERIASRPHVTGDAKGPVDVPTEKRNADRAIWNDLGGFWASHEDIASQIGCYLFSNKTIRDDARTC
jgi:hypothetical protein